MIDELKKEIEGVTHSFLKEIEQLQSPENFSALKERYLSRKKGVISMYLSRLKEFSAAEKPLAGQAIDPAALAAAQDTYYQMMGWDPLTAAPTLAKLQELDIEWAAGALPR